MVEPSSIEICTGSFVAPGEQHWRWLDTADLERIDVEALAARGIFLDPFDLRPLAKRTRYQVAPRTEWPDDVDPFDVNPIVVQSGTVEEDLIVEWDAQDRKNFEKFEAASRLDILGASLDAVDKWLAVRDPFNVRVRLP